MPKERERHEGSVSTRCCMRGMLVKLYHTHPRAGRAGAPRPPTFRKTNAPAGPFVADAFSLVTVHDGILKQRAWRAVAHALRRLKSLDRLYRVASLRHRHSLYSTTPTPPMGSDPLGSTVHCQGGQTLHATSIPRMQHLVETDPSCRSLSLGMDAAPFGR